MADGDQGGGGDRQGDRRMVVQLPTPSGKRHVPTEETRALAFRAFGMGLTQPQVGILLGIHKDTVGKYYEAELRAAEGLLNFNVASNLYSIATDRTHKGSVAAAIFWMKARGGWRETNRVEVTGADGGAIQHSVVSMDVIPARELSPDDRDALKERLIEAMQMQALPSVAMPEVDKTTYRILDDGKGPDEDDGDWVFKNGGWVKRTEDDVDED